MTFSLEHSNPFLMGTRLSQMGLEATVYLELLELVQINMAFLLFDHLDGSNVGLGGGVLSAHDW